MRAHGARARGVGERIPRACAGGRRAARSSCPHRTPTANGNGKSPERTSVLRAIDAGIRLAVIDAGGIPVEFLGMQRAAAAGWAEGRAHLAVSGGAVLLEADDAAEISARVVGDPEDAEGKGGAANGAAGGNGERCRGGV